MVVHDAAADEELQEAVDILGMFVAEGQEQFLSAIIKSEKALDKLSKLKNFYENHCRCRCYSFQVNRHISFSLY